VSDISAKGPEKPPEKTSVKTASQQLLERAAPARAEWEDLVIVPIFAVIVALALGALVMLATNVDLPTIGRSYIALLVGSVGSLNAISETLTAAAPLILAALGLGIGFRAGLFNIGAEGQLLMGGLAAVLVGFLGAGLPFFIHLPLALLAGAIAGGLYASIAGWLRVATGAHEVISTIMLNLISYRFLDYVLRLDWVQLPGRADPDFPVGRCVGRIAATARVDRSKPAGSCRDFSGVRRRLVRLLAAVSDHLGL
jgi:ABC-type uncharacterized transport system permease subunit